MTTLINEIRFACRSLSKTRGFAVSAIGSLALGMMLCTTAAAVMKAYLLEQLPIPRPSGSIRFATPLRGNRHRGKWSGWTGPP